MADYTETYTKVTSNVVDAADFETEFDAIATAVATKANKISSATANNVVEQDANGDLVDTGLATPTGTFVGTSDTQTLTNKTLASPVITTLFTATGLVKVADLTTTPNFRTTMSGTQEVGTTVEKIVFDTEVFDSTTDYDPSTNYRFTPTTAGVYAVSTSLYFSSVFSATAAIATAYIYKNGSEYAYTTNIANSNSLLYTVVVSCLVTMNGSSDYIEAWGSTTGTSETVTNNNSTFFEAHWVGN